MAVDTEMNLGLHIVSNTSTEEGQLEEAPAAFETMSAAREIKVDAVRV